MNQVIHRVVSGIVFFSLSSRAIGQPFDESLSITSDRYPAPITKTIAVPQGDVSVDDYIIALSKASEMSFLADVTSISLLQISSFPASEQARNGKWKPTFYGVLADFKNLSRTDSLRYDANTYLLWDAPFTRQMAHQIVAEGNYGPIHELPDQNELHKAISSYAQAQLKWKPNTDLPSSKIKLRDLPVNLSNAFMALAWQRIWRPALRQDLLLSDDYWQNVRLRVLTKEMAGGAIMPYLVLLGQDEKGNKLPLLRFEYANITAVDNKNEFAWRGEPPKIEKNTVLPPITSPVEQPLAMPQDHWSKILEKLRPDFLTTDAKLTVKVSLEAKRQTLSDFLGQASAKTGVTLSVKENPETKHLITARVEAMPLASLMGSLSRLYLMTWEKKSDAEYIFHTAGFARSQFIQGGRDFSAELDPPSWQTWQERHKQLQDLQKEIIRELNPEMARSEAGVAVTALPEDLQYGLRLAVDEIAAEEIVNAYLNTHKFLSLDSVVQIIGEKVFNTTTWRVHILKTDGAHAIMSTQFVQASFAPQAEKPAETTEQAIKRLEAGN